jgi:hypothetical protein
VGGPHLKELCIIADYYSFFLQLGPADVQALQSSIGGAVTDLSFGHCTLMPGFWRALAELFPTMRTLRICDCMCEDDFVYTGPLPRILNQFGCPDVVVQIVPR